MAPPLQLLVNGTGATGMSGWTVASGSWSFDGSKWQAGNVASGEMYQDIDVSGFADAIDAGIGTFKYIGVTSSFNQAPPDTAQQIVQYRDADSAVLESYDTGATANTGSAVTYTDQRAAPVGTRTIRVRWISVRNSGTANDGYHHRTASLTYYPPTKEQIESGTGVVALVVAIEGYPYLLTNWHDTDAVVTAWSETSWTQVLGGLDVTGEFTQEIRPLQPDIDVGSMTFVVGDDQDGNDTFAKAVFSQFKSSGITTELTANADPSDATMTVLDNSDLASAPATAYVGTENIQYGAKSGTTSLTTLTRGRFAPFGKDGSDEWARFHSIGNTAGAATYRPPLTDWKRVWIGCHIGLWVHSVHNGALVPQSGAHLLFAGTIADIQDTEQGLTEIVAEDIRRQVGDCMLLADQYSAEPLEGAVLGTQDFITLIEASKTTGGTEDFQEDTFTSSDLGTGRTTASELIDKINDAIASSATLAKVWEFQLLRNNRSNVVCGFTGTYLNAFFQVVMSRSVAELLGFDVDSAKRTVDDRGPSLGYVFESTLRTGTDVVAGLRSHYAVAYAAPHLNSGLTLTVAADTGTFVNQGDQMPARIRVKYGTDTGTWGFLRYRDFTFLASQQTATTFKTYWDDDIQRMFNQTAESISFSPGDNVVRVGDPIPRFTQVVFFDEDFATCIPRLFASTGDSAYNHATYDAYDRQLGAAVPWSLLGSNFLGSVNDIAEVGETRISILLDKPTRLSEILIPELALRNAHLVFRNGVLVFTRPSGAFDTADHTLTDDTMWGDADSPESVRPSVVWSRDMIVNVLKLEYDRGLDGKLNSDIEVRNATSIAEYGLSNPVTIQARNTVTRGQSTDPASIYDLVAKLAADMLAIYDEPLQVVSLPVSGDVLVTMAPGDSVSLSNSFIRYHGDGTRGVTNVAAYVLRTAFDPVTLRGDVTLVLTGGELARSAIFSPAAKIDETHTTGLFTSGYDNTNDIIRLKANEFSESDEGADVTHFAVNDAIRIIERSPATPASPQSWTVTIDAIDTTNSELTLSAALTGFDSTLEYYVISDDYSAAATSQKTDCYIADDTDDKIVNTERSRTWRHNSPGLFEIAAVGSANVRHEYPPTDGQWWSEGKPLHPAVFRSLGNTVNNLISHRTAPQTPIWFADTVSFSTALSEDAIFYFPLVVPSGFAVTRKLVVGPRIRRVSGVTTTTIKVYSSANLPDPEFSPSAINDIEFNETTQSVSFTTSSSTFENKATQELTLIPNSGGLFTWITVAATTNGTSEMAGWHTWYVKEIS